MSNSTKDIMVQCELEKKTETGSVTKTVTWIPECYAKVGRYIKLKDNEGLWEDGWRVVCTGSKMIASTLTERSQDFKRTRKASDI